MKKYFGKRQPMLFAILLMALIAAMMFTPATVIKSEAAQGKMFYSEKQDSKNLKPTSFRVFLGDTSLQATPSGAYYTVYFSYLPSMSHWQVDGVDDFLGNPVSYTVVNGTFSNWNGSMSQLTISNLSIDVSVSGGGTDNIYQSSLTIQMH